MPFGPWNTLPWWSNLCVTKPSRTAASARTCAVVSLGIRWKHDVHRRSGTCGLSQLSELANTVMPQPAQRKPAPW